MLDNLGYKQIAIFLKEVCTVGTSLVDEMLLELQTNKGKFKSECNALLERFH